MLLKITKNSDKYIKFVVLNKISLYEKIKGNNVQIVHAKQISHSPNHSHFWWYFNFTISFHKKYIHKNISTNATILIATFWNGFLINEKINAIIVVITRIGKCNSYFV